MSVWISQALLSGGTLSAKISDGYFTATMSWPSGDSITSEETRTLHGVFLSLEQKIMAIDDEMLGTEAN